MKETVLKEVKEIKSLFATNTFRALIGGLIVAIAPLIGVAIKEKRLTVDNAVQIVVTTAIVSMGVAGRVAGNNSLVYTEDWMAGANKSDFLPLPVEEGEPIEGVINNAGVASVSEQADTIN